MTVDDPVADLRKQFADGRCSPEQIQTFEMLLAGASGPWSGWRYQPGPYACTLKMDLINRYAIEVTVRVNGQVAIASLWNKAAGLDRPGIVLSVVPSERQWDLPDSKPPRRGLFGSFVAEWIKSASASVGDRELIEDELLAALDEVEDAKRDLARCDRNVLEAMRDRDEARVDLVTAQQRASGLRKLLQSRPS